MRKLSAPRRRRPHRPTRIANSLLIENLEQRLLLTGDPKNQSPINFLPRTQSMLEGQSLAFQGASGNQISITDPDAGARPLEVTLSASIGKLSLADSNGLQFSQGDGISDGTMQFRGSQAAINDALATLTFVPPSSFFGKGTLTISTNDLGHSGSGGAQTDTDKLTINIAGINDAPSFVRGPSETVLEDSGAQQVKHWATHISAGANEQFQKLKFIVTNDNPSLFAKSPTVNSKGTLSYTLAPNATGTANVKVRLQDDGGTENGGIDTSDSQSFKIRITPVNDRPSFTKGKDQTVLEDSGPIAVAAWATKIRPGPANESSQHLKFSVSNDNKSLFSSQPAIAADGTLSFTPAHNANGSAKVTVRLKDDGGTTNHGSDKSSSQTFIITVKPVNDAPRFVKGKDQTAPKNGAVQTIKPWATSISPGPADEKHQVVSFQVTTDKPSLFTVPPVISPEGILVYMPARNATGIAVVTVSLKDTGGTKNGGRDTSAPQTFTITVGSPKGNVAPSFTKGADQSVLEDSGMNSVANWATHISAGPAGEASQVVQFLVTADRPELFAVQPAISPSGTLTYTLAPNANGNTTVAVRLMDNGGTANGGVDLSPAQSFSIHVIAVNDAPTFVKGANQRVNPADGAVSVSGWATAISPGPSDEAAQSLTFLVSADDLDLFDVLPIVSASGKLTFTPKPGVIGTTTVSVRLKDTGGTANGGVDTSAAQQFTISLSPDFDGPVLDAALQNDTAPGGTTNADGITFDPTIAGIVFDSQGVASLVGAVDNETALPITVDSDGTFAFSPPLALDGSADGGHVVHLVALDVFGNETDFDVPFTLDTVGPAAPGLTLSAASGVVGSQTSNAARVNLFGTTDPGSTVTLAETSATALANGAGHFEFVSVPLSLGDNSFNTTAVDVAGNVTQTSTTIRRVDTTSQLDPVLLWNQTVLQAIRGDATDPTRASRGLAMVQAAVYDVVNAIEGRRGYYVTLTAPTGASLEAAIAAAAHEVLSYLFPAQHALFDAVLDTSLGHVADGSAKTASVAFGRQIGDAIISLRAGDGWNDYVVHNPVNEPGHWAPSAPMYAPALDPQWATLQPWVMSSSDQFLPPGPPSLTSQTWADAYNEVKDYGAYNSTVRTADQTQIARFWSDGAGTSTPPGHWNDLAQQIAMAEGNSTAENARLFAMLDITLADAAIVSFNSKYNYDFWRPIAAIPGGDTDGNDLTLADPSWQPFLITPNFPEYVSGHSTFSGAAATILDAVFGSNYAFSTSSEGLTGVTRSFVSFDAAAAEAGKSRIYGGIHWEFSNQDGQAAGRALANYVLTTFDTSSDTVAPRVLVDDDAGQATKTNPTISGHVLDNLSGVKSLTASLDGQMAVAVAFNSLGQFSYTPTLATNGSGDGPHTVTFVAADIVGNVSASVSYTFTLDTVAPSLTIQSPLNGGSLTAGATLTGTVGISGSSIVQLDYKFAGQPTTPIIFDPQTGQFNASLDLSKLSPGATTLTVSTRDAAGNTKSVTLNLNLAARVPFKISKFTPLDGAKDVGATYKPQVFFSRPVNPASLNANNFYATGPNGAKLAANIVPAGDGSFAWLFFAQPMPGGSRITVHLDGSTIQAASDGAALDADGNGTAGGTFTFEFSTVSLTPLVGTSLSGKLLDVGPDLKPMTYDDIRVGPDQILHTADDVFLLPIAGVRVAVVGLPDLFTFTDSSGNFHFDSVPAGDIKLAVDGRTATNAPAGIFFPEMVMDLQMEAGRANTVMGTMGTAEERAANRDRQEIYLPRVQTSILQNVSNSAPTLITTGADAAPNLTPQQRSQLTIEVQPGSLRDQNGNLLTTGQVGISTVPPSLVREMLPPGLLEHTFDITVQAPGITNFATPAPMTFPNVFGAAPGTQLNFLSFDHTTGRLVIEGTATVSADGLSVHTDPGTGITHPGWHGLTPQGSPTSPKPLVVAENIGTGFSYTFSGVTDYLFTKDRELQRLEFVNTSDPKKNDGSRLRVLITVYPTTEQYVDGLHTQMFDLQAGEYRSMEFGFKDVDIRRLEADQLIGVKYSVQMWRVNSAGTPIETLPVPGDSYLYRYVDASDSNSGDGIMQFADTVNDGANGATRERRIVYKGDPAAQPSIDQFSSVNSPYKFDNAGTIYSITFDPQQTKDNQSTDIQIFTPGANSRVVGTPGKLIAFGNGVNQTIIYLNKAQFIQQFTQLTFNNGPVGLQLQYNPSLLKSIPPPQFSLTPHGYSVEGQHTRNLKIGATGDQVKAALVGDFPTIFRNDNIDVVLTTQDIPAQGSTAAKRIDSYTIKPKNGLNFNTVSHTFTVNSASTGHGLTWSEARVVPRGALTQNEIDYLKAPGKLDEIFAGFAANLNRAYSSYSSAIRFSEDAPPLSSGFFSLDWVTELPRTSGVVAEFPVSSEPKMKALLRQLSAPNASYSIAQSAFLIGQVLSQSAHSALLDHTGHAYIQQFFSPGTSLQGDLSEQDLITVMSNVISHELGHGLGLEHTAFQTIVSGNSEVQKIVVNPDATSIVLNYAGDSTAFAVGELDANSLQTNLSMLFGLVGRPIKVTPGAPGEYFVDFDPVPTSNPRSALAYVDVPQITGQGVTTSTEREAHLETTYQLKNEVVLNGELGRNDYMRSTTTLDSLSFLPSISDVWLRMSTGSAYTQNVVNLAEDILVLTASATNNFRNITAPALPGNDPDVDADVVPYDGPGLALFDENGQFADRQPLDFGDVDPNQPITKKLTLFNYGGEPAVVRSISVTQGFDRFSVAQIPVTTLQPGDSLEVDVTFNSVLNLTSIGRLVVDASANVLGGDLDLVGTGQLTNQPQILVDFYNNLGGYLVGTNRSEGPGGSLPPLITNQGSAPLTITEVRVAAGQGSDEYFTEPLSAPITLAPGESTSIGFRFRPSKVGIRPGALEVVSNDPNTPILRIAVVGTGVLTNDDGNTFEGADLGNDYVAVKSGLDFENNLPELRTKSDDGGNWNFFLPAQTDVRVVTYDPVSGLVAHSGGFTNAAGMSTELNTGLFRPSVDRDSDGDGLPDDVEFAIGTNPNKIDTDGDGKNDFAELDSGLNPLDDRPAAVGVVSALGTGGSAKDVKLAADFRDASRTLAFVASGSAGITIVDVTDFNQPITIAKLNLPGTINKISIDADRKLLAAASATSGVHLIDISDPGNPVLLRTIEHQGADPVKAVELYDGIVYIGVGSKVRAFDVASGELSDEVTLTNPIVQGMTRSGTKLYVTTRDVLTNLNWLQVVDIAANGLAAQGVISLPATETVGDPFVVDNVAWIPAADRVVTVNVGNPQSLQIIAGTQTLQQAIVNDIDLTGSGLGIVSGTSIGVGTVFVMQTPNPQTVNQVFTQFNLPDSGENGKAANAAALAAGFAYIADGTAGLQLVNYIQFDVGSTPPTILVDPITGDIDTTAPGLQMLETATLTVPAHVTDDVQVRSVELLMNGKVVRKEVTYPYDLTVTLPKIADAGNQVTLQVRATDTGGNVSLSQPIVIDLRPDIVPPTVSTVDPPDGSTQPLSRRKVSITFSEPIDRSTAVPSSFVLHGPNGNVAPVSVDLRQHDTRIDILYPPLAEGSYTFTIHGPALTDRAGNPLAAADITSTFSVTAVTRQPTIRWVNDAGGSWSDPNNWRDAATNQPRVPTATDDVLMDVPTDAIITLSSGTVTVNSVISNEQFQLTGGRLNVIDTIQVNNTFLIKGTNSNAPTTFSGTILKGTGGQGVTVQGEDRLDGATVQTDILVNGTAPTNLRLANGLALGGTMTFSVGNSSLLIEGTQTISSGTIASTSLMYVQSAGTGNSTLTLGQDVTFKAQVVFQSSFTDVGRLSLINRGTITTPGIARGDGAFTRTESFTNYGLMTNQSGGQFSIEDKTFLNAASGRIIISEAARLNLRQGSFGSSSTTLFTNAGTIELHNTDAQFMTRTDGVGQTWSNTGNILNDKSVVGLYGTFGSESLKNVQNTGSLSINGVMDNVGRSFTFTTDLGRVYLQIGRIHGGTLVMGGPNARLDFLGGLGTLDGVTIQGDVALGAPLLDPFGAGLFMAPCTVAVVNGLTLQGTFTLFIGPSLETLRFDGAQTVSGGTLQFLPVGNGFSGQALGTGISAFNGGPVVFDSSVTIRGGTGGSGASAASVSGNIISYANVVIDNNSSIRLIGLANALNPAVAGPFVNRGTISVPTGRTLATSAGFTNEGQITVNGGAMSLDATYGFKNTGTIDLSGHGQLSLGSAGPALRTSDLGNFIAPDAIVELASGFILDNSNAVLPIGGTSTWYSGGTIVGGTVNIASTAKFIPISTTLKDVTVNGNMAFDRSLSRMNLVGDLTFNGTVSGTANNTITFGDASNYPNVPVHILAGTIDLALSSFTAVYASSGTPSITLDPGVVLKGRRLVATITAPITNKGLIVADQSTGGIGEVFDLTTAPITNLGTLAAVTKSILKLSTLAAPNSGTVSAAAGSSVAFTGDFAQTSAGTTHVDVSGTASTQFGLIAVTGAATLAGTLDVQFTGGFTPAAGNTFKVMTYGSHTGQFATVHVVGLAAGLIVTPQYNGTDLTLVVSAGGSGLAAPAQQAGAASAQSPIFVPNSGVVAPSSGNANAAVKSDSTHSAARPNYPLAKLSIPQVDQFYERNLYGKTYSSDGSYVDNADNMDEWFSNLADDGWLDIGDVNLAEELSHVSS